MKKPVIMAIPSGTPKTAHSLLLIDNLPAQMMLGILPGISIPPAIKRPAKANFIVCADIRGVISAAVSVALSRMAEMIFTQYRAAAGICTRYLSTNGVKPVPKNTSARTKR